MWEIVPGLKCAEDLSIRMVKSRWIKKRNASKADLSMRRKDACDMVSDEEQEYF
jgi:hypothetical protein